MMNMGMGFGHGPGWFGFRMGGHRRGGRRFKRGILKFIVLKLLDEQGRHGYDLIRTLRSKGWPGGAGAIYPILSALEAEGLIVGRDEGDRRTYEISEKGRRLLEEHSAASGGFFEKFFEDDEEEGGAPGETRSDLSDAAARLMQAISQLGPSSKPETIERVRDLIDRARREIYTLLAQE